MSRLTLLFALASLFSKYDASRILTVIPTPSISHQVVYRPFIQELVRRGHEVVVLTTDPAYPKGQAPVNLTEIDLHDISYEVWRKQITANTENGDRHGLRKQVKDFSRVCFDIFLLQAELPEVQDIIKNKNNTFDLIIVETWPRFVLGFSHVIKAPVISFSSFGAIWDIYNVIGAPSHPFLYHIALHTRVHNLTLWDKLRLYYDKYLIMHHYNNEQEEYENTGLRNIFGEDMPPLSELQNNIDMLFLNIHPIFEGIKPVPPGVVYVGGLHQNLQKELPDDLKTYLDSSVHGVIYLSFGTNVDPSVLPAEKIQAIIKAFSQLPYDVLWKWNEDVLPGRTENIRISKWLPQSDLLRHPKIKLFITQGGLQSTDEAITAGVPLVGIPMLGDQWFNVEQYVYHKIGIGIQLNELEAEVLKSAIETVIGDKSYRENVVRLRILMNDQPMSSLERAVWWTEHVLRHGGARHLRAPAANMSWAQYYELDLVLTVLGIASAALVIVSLLLIKLVTLVLRRVSGSVKIKSS